MLNICQYLKPKGVRSIVCLFFVICLVATEGSLNWHALKIKNLSLKERTEIKWREVDGGKRNLEAQTDEMSPVGCHSIFSICSPQSN